MTPDRTHSQHSHDGARHGMRRSCTLLLALRLSVLTAGALAGPVLAGPHPAWGPDRAGGYASTHVVLKLRAGVQPGLRADGRPTLRAAPPNQPSHAIANALDAALRQWNVSVIAPAFRDPPANQALAARLGLDRYVRVDVPTGSNTPSLAAALRRFNTLIESAEIDGLGGVATIPNDTDLDLQWGLLNVGQSIGCSLVSCPIFGGTSGMVGADIQAAQAWDISTGSSSVTVAIIDSGVDAHDELAGRLLPGYYVIDGSVDTGDECEHGTHVAGIAAAAGNNGMGIAGVAWNIMVLPVRVLQSCSVSSAVGEVNTAAGLIWAVDHGAHVANMSLQFFAGTSVLHDAVIYARQSGMVLVAATGNQGTASVAYPARWPETIAVAATNHLDQRWAFSSFGPEVDVAAPGVCVWSLLNTTSYCSKNGTSMATAHVSGIACLIRSINPALTPDQVATIVTTTADDVDAPGFDEFTGHGRVNAFAALQLAQQSLFHPADLNQDGHVNGFDLAILLGQWTGAGTYVPCPPHQPADLNQDCKVSGLDLAILLGAWG